MLTGVLGEGLCGEEPIKEKEENGIGGGEGKPSNKPSRRIRRRIEMVFFAL